MINLNGTWNYILDKDSELTFNTVRRRINAEKYSGEIKVPSNWNFKTLTEFSGTLWYVRKIKIPKNSFIKKLHFSGVDYFTSVWFNWNFIGSHEGYFQEFDFFLPERILKRNENILLVKVTSPVEEPDSVWPDKKQLIKGIFNHHDCRPGGWNKKNGQDRNTGGIWNDVKIIFEKKISITKTKISSKIFDKKVELKITFDYKSFLNFETIALTKIYVKSKNRSGKKFLREIKYSSQCGTATAILTIHNPEYWNPYELGEPIITTIKISSELFNDVKITYGIREVKLNGKSEFFINGKRLFLRGTNIIPEQFLSNLTKAKIKRLIELLLKANINIVRVHAHVNRKELYEAFDKAGILIWQDFALQWTYEETNSFRVNAVKQIKDMVNQFYNSPSIAFWCCHNEPGEQINTLDKYLFDAVAEEDNTRIIRMASNYEEHPYEGWYWGKADDFISTPMGPLVTEFGAQALPEYSSLKKILTAKDIEKYNWEKWEYHNFQYEQTFNVAGVPKGNNIKEFIESSQKYQAELIEKAIDYYRRKKWDGINGVFQFMFIDGWESISWAVVDYFGKAKLGYYALQKAFEPIYISIDLKKERYQNGAELFVGVYIINDLHKTFRNMKIIMYLEGTEIVNIGKVNIEADSVLYLNEEYFNTKINISAGKKTLEVVLVNSQEKIISRQQKEIMIFGPRN